MTTMRKDQEKLRIYEAFGELLYIVAMADGIIQVEETEKLNEILKGHPWSEDIWSEDIKWSFNYEAKKDHNVEYLYKKVIDTFEQHGADPEYAYFIKAIEQLAEASDGIDEKEGKLINKITKDIAVKLKMDVDKLNAGLATGGGAVQ
jgi:uncharacterized tellurite resistance protein B-like protein